MVEALAHSAADDRDGVAGAQIDREAVADELVGLGPPREAGTRFRPQRPEDREAGADRLEGEAVGHVKLNAAAVLARELLERRPEPRGPEMHTRQSVRLEEQLERAHVHRSGK